MTTQPDGSSPSKPDANNPTIRILKELGEVMIPLSLWAIIAQLLSLSIQTTGLISLYIIIVLYTWLYRHWINHRVRASLVIFFAVTATVGALLIPKTVGYSDESLSRSGIVSYGEQANDWAIPKVPMYASKAKHEVWYMGVDFHISASQHQELHTRHIQAAPEDSRNGKHPFPDP